MSKSSTLTDDVTIRVSIGELDRNYEYYLMLVERDRRKVIITRDGKDFAILIPHDQNWSEIE